VAAALGSGAVLFLFDLAKHGFYPICLFHSLTGLNCPGCGATRAAYQLLHGHLLRALHDKPCALRHQRCERQNEQRIVLQRAEQVAVQ